MENREHSTFASRQLPWMLAAGAFIVYLVTINRWISLSSLQMATMVTDPSSSIPFTGPLLYLLACLLGWLPGSAQIHASNLFSALFASATLGMLARSVALLPQDRTRDQRHRERSDTGLLSLNGSWLPPLAAVLACGLQLAFWEHATAGTGQMLNLAILAYLVLSLLEYRIDERESRLTRMALVFGIAMTNSPNFIAMLPLFLIALVWVRGRDFFNLRFLARMLAFGVAGLSFYLLLPLLSQFSDTAVVSFWQALRAQFAEQKNILLGIPRYVVLFGALFSILPLAFIGIRWPSTVGDTSPLGVRLTNLFFRVVHALFLAGCLWVIFDAPFSPRVLIENIQDRQSADIALGLPFLGFHFFTSLCIGYWVGYFLLLSSKPEERAWRRSSTLDELAGKASQVAVWTLVLAIPAGLIYRNWAPIRANDGRLLRDFAALTLRNIPEDNAVAMADDPLLLNLVRVLDRQSRGGADRLMIYTPLMPYAMYQKSLNRLFPSRWVAPPEETSDYALLDTRLLVLQVQSIVSTNPTYYLHPSFGFFFERMYLQSAGMSYPLAIYPTNQIAPPPLSPEAQQRNNDFWAEVSPKLRALPALVARKVPDARAVARWYARAMNYWGVELEKANRLEEAGRLFSDAIQLNPDNLVAQINLQFNESLQRGNAMPDLAKSTDEQFGAKYRTWDAFLAANGPVDEPSFRVRLGRLLNKQGNVRQAMLQYQRCVELQPENRTALLDLAEVYLTAGLPQKTLETTTRLRSVRSTPAEQIDSIRLEAEAQVSMQDAATAEQTLLHGLEKHPNAESLMDALAELYKITDQPDKALKACDRLLEVNPRATMALIRKAVLYMKKDELAKAEATLNTLSQVAPDSVEALLPQSAFLIQTKRYLEALKVTNRILEIEPRNQYALVNRAIALLQSDQLEEAKSAYLELHERMPLQYQFQYGLGEVAYRQKNREEAITYFELYLQNAPTDTDEARQITERLHQLRAKRN